MRACEKSSEQTLPLWHAGGLFSILLFGGLWGLVGMIIAVLYDLAKRLIRRGLAKNGDIVILHQCNQDYNGEQPPETEQQGKDPRSLHSRDP